MSWVIRVQFVCLAALLGACGGGSNTAPVSSDAAFVVDEDTDLAGQVSATDADGDAVRYRLSSQPRHGRVTLQSASGAFVYQGSADFSGADSFAFAAMDAKGAASAPAQVSIQVLPVNDAPRIQPVPDLENSPETYEVRASFSVHDVEGDPLSLSVDVQDQTVVEATLDIESGLVRLHPRGTGQTTVSLQASDGDLSSSDSFLFRVAPVTKSRSLAGRGPYEDAIKIVNEGPRDVHFSLRHNSAVLAGSLHELVEEAMATPGASAGKIERRLWAYVNNGTYHWHSLTGGRWVHDPLIMMNSVGFGLCDDVAAALALLGQAAGLQSRVWALEGHVVAELGSDGDMDVYDADLSVFYHDRTGSVAGVDSLVADTSLITEPSDPVREDHTTALAYSESIASIYASSHDNQVYDWYMESAPPIPGVLRLPAGGSVMYPGLWTQAPHSTGGTGADAPVYANLMMTVPAGWSGVIDMPLVLRAVRGAGLVRVGTGEYEIGSAALQASLDHTPNWIPDIEVLRSDTVIELVFLINPLRFGATDNVELAVTSVDAWALSVSMMELPPANRRSEQQTEIYRKPLMQ